MTSRVVHFEVPVENMGRAINFYKNVFGWKFDEWDGPEKYMMVTTGKKSEMGINGGMVAKSKKMPYVINTIGVKSVDDFIEEIKKNGGKIITSKTVIPKIGYMAYFKDTEDNIFGIMESDMKAK